MADGDASNPRWSVAILSSREDAGTLMAAIDSVRVACAGHEAIIDVVVNGNEELARAAADAKTVRAGPTEGIAFRVWHVPLGDKSHAWNEYLHRIWPASSIAFFVDGYVQVRPDAFRLIAEGLASRPSALAASGVPTVGRSAKKLRKLMLEEGGVHGNMYAIRGSTMQRLRSSGFRLPLGMYRTDSTVFAAICFGLDPSRNEWDMGRVFVHPTATWTNPTLSWTQYSALVTHAKRTFRQAQGALISRAVRAHLALEKRPPEALPETAAELVNSWINRYRAEARWIFLKNPLSYFAAKTFLKPRDWSKAHAAPVLLTTPDLSRK